MFCRVVKIRALDEYALSLPFEITVVFVVLRIAWRTDP